MHSDNHHSFIQDGPLQCGTFIFVLEGEKHLALLGKRRAPPGVEDLLAVRDIDKLRESVIKAGLSPRKNILVLKEGQFAYVPPGTWHAALNVSRCVSMNVSALMPAKGENVGHALYLRCMQAVIDARKVHYDKVALWVMFGPGMKRMLERGLSLFLDEMHATLGNEGSAGIAGMKWAMLSPLVMAWHEWLTCFEWVVAEGLVEGCTKQWLKKVKRNQLSFDKIFMHT